MKIVDVEKLDTGMTVSMVSGTVKMAWERKEQTGEYGPFTTQGIVLSDETGEIVCQIGNHPEIKKGDSIILKSKEGKKGLEGIVISEWDSKKQLKITKSAILSVNDTMIPKTQENASNVPLNAKNDHSGEGLPAPDWDSINLRNMRSIAISYAKDLAVGQRINVNDIPEQAEKFVQYIYTGKVEPEICF